MLTPQQRTPLADTHRPNHIFTKAPVLKVPKLIVDPKNPQPLELFRLAVAYEMGAHGLEQDYVTALATYLQAAVHHHHVPSMCNIGVLYINGKLGFTSEYGAVSWFKQAADKKHPMGMFNLAMVYLYGIDIKADYSEAQYWFNQAAQIGFEPAKNHLDFTQLNEASVTSKTSGSNEIRMMPCHQAIEGISPREYLFSDYCG